MAKSFTCKDVGVDCDWTAQGETEGDILQQVGPHAASVHGITQVPPDMLDKVKAAIKDT